MDLKKVFGIDKHGAENGKWFNLSDGGRVKVARLGNPRFRAEVIRLQKPHRSIIKSGQADTSDLMEEVTLRAMAKTILVDWSDISVDGQPVDYTPERAYEFLIEYPDFREVVSALSADQTSFSLEDVAGE